MKKLFVLSVLICTCVVQALAQELYEWTDANGVTWTFCQESFYYDNTSHNYYTIIGVANYGNEVVVPQTVYDGDTPYTIEAIYSYVFRDNSTLNSVTLPATIKYIGGFAFYGCTALTTITGTANCEIVGEQAFTDCSNLAAIDLSQCLEIASYAFCNCNSLTTIVSIANCRGVGSHAFSGCSALQEVDLGDNVTIASQAFYDCGQLKSVGSLKGATIGKEAFNNCKNLTTIDISQSASLGTYAFASCSNLTSVGDLSAYTAIPSYVFAGCIKLESVNLSNCKTIGDNAFYNCSSITELTLPKVKTIGKQAFGGCWSLDAPNITSTELTSVGANAFNCAGTITLMSTTPATLASNDAFGTMMIVRVPDAAVATYHAADKWSDFKDRIVGISTQTDYNINVTAMANKSALIDKIGEDKVGLVVSLKITGDINGYDIMAIRNKMDNLHYLDLSDANIVANDYEYYTGYHTEDNVLGTCSFYNLPKLVSVKLPKTITKIGDYAFQNCSNLNEIVFQPGLESIGSYAFQNCRNIRELNFKQGLKTIGREAFGYIWGNSEQVRIEELVLPEGVESIGVGAFASIFSLERVALPSTLKTMGSFAFRYCYQLGSISLPTSLQSIPESAFSGCSSLTEVRIPSTITSIGDDAFGKCPQLNDVYTYIAEPTQINMNTFSTYTSALLHVPSTSYWTYYYDTEWSQFGHLQEFDAEYEYFYINKDFTISDDAGTIHGDGDNDPDADLNPGSGLIVETENDTQELNEVHIMMKGSSCASIIAASNIVANKVYFDIEVEKARWYFLCFPFNVKMVNVEAPGNYVFRTYDPEERANGKTGWVNWIGDELEKGQGYIFHCSKAGILSLCVEKEDMNWSASDRPAALAANAAASEQDASWNFIGNPHTSYYDIDNTGYTQPITVWNGTSYEAVRPGDDEYCLSPCEGFFVQKPENQSEMNFPAGDDATDGRYTKIQWEATANNRAAARRAKGVNVDRQIINLTLTDGQSTDKTRVVFNEKQSADYEMACDAPKFMSTESVPQLYTLDQKNTKYAINERPLGEVRLGYVATKKGELTIEAQRMDQPVLLRDNLMQTTHDLSMGGYTFTTEAGSIDDRFVMITNGDFTSIGKLRQETGVSALAEKGGISFSGIDQQDVVIYSVSGVTLGSHVQNGFIQLPSATYIVKVNNETTKLIVR